MHITEKTHEFVAKIDSATPLFCLQQQRRDSLSFVEPTGTGKCMRGETDNNQNSPEPFARFARLSSVRCPGVAIVGRVVG